MGTGDYNRIFTRLVYGVTKATTTGQPVRGYTAAGDLFGKLEMGGASKREWFGELNSQADAVITLRQYPDLGGKDRLRDKKFNDLYQIEGFVRLDTNETKVMVTRVTEVE